MTAALRLTGVRVLLGMWLTTACTAPTYDAAPATIQVPSSTPVKPREAVRLQAPLSTQGNLVYGFGETDAVGRPYPGWMLYNEAPTMQLTAMADGDIVMSVPLLLGRTSFVRIQLRSSQHDIEYIVASKKPLTMPALTPRQRVKAGDVLYDASITSPEYVAVSVVDRATQMHVCPRELIDSALVDALAQRMHRRAEEWCVADQIPYTDSGLIIPIKGYEDAEAAQVSATSTVAPTPAVTVSATVPVRATAVATQARTPDSTATPVPTPIAPAATNDTIGALIYPVRDIASIRIMEAFSTDASAPWGFAHNGIDFMTDRDREPVIASADGTIARVDVKRYPPLNNWQINIALRINNRYSIAYSLEPMTSDDAIGQTQQALVAVTVGQSVRAGDVIGELIGGVNGAHVHWGISDATVDRAICPAPFLTEAQQGELRARIPSNPDRLCYP